MEWDWEQLLETLDKVPEWAKGLYKKNAEGKFELLPEVAEKVDTSGLTSALQKERTNAKEARKALDAYQKLGKLEEIQAKLDKANDAGDDKGAAKWEKAKADLIRQHQEELKAKDVETDKMRRSLDQYLIDAEATAAISELKGSATLLLPHVRNKVKVFQENDTYVARVVDKEGDPRIDSKGQPMGVKELVAELRKSKDYAMAFEASGASGSGKQPNNQGAGTATDSSKLSANQKIALGIKARDGGQG